MTALLIIVLVTVIGIILLAQLGKGYVETEEEHRERIDSLARQIASHDQEPQTASAPGKEDRESLRKKVEDVVRDNLEVTLTELPLTDCTKVFDLKGLYYRSLSEQERAERLENGEELKLVLEPDNPQDPYAVKVMTTDDVLIGYVPKEMSEKVTRNISFLKECSVWHISHEGIPNIYVSFRMVGKSTYYWEKYLVDNRTWHDYRLKYEELQVNLCALAQENPQAVVAIWENLHKRYPADEYIEYEYIMALYDIGSYTRTIEQGKAFMDRLNLYGFKKLENVILSAKRKQNELEAALVLKKFAAIYQTGYDSLKANEFEEALSNFMQCWDSPYQVQALPKNICKCYEKLHRTEDCVDFAKSAMKRRWLTQATKDALQKYIDKYSAI